MDSAATTCSRCGAELLVVTAAEYLIISDEALDFVLHEHGEPLIAIMDKPGSYACPVCGKHDRLPPRTTRS